ncbi:MAG: phenylalanine--tRNA ligase subunit alpha [Planctomycetaceae bacterium]|nr:phenylalanine--tRNA ligase subunit alpha [Planctomycetaceae bacterium]
MSVYVLLVPAIEKLQDARRLIRISEAELDLLSQPLARELKGIEARLTGILEHVAAWCLEYSDHRDTETLEEFNNDLARIDADLRRQSRKIGDLPREARREPGALINAMLALVGAVKCVSDESSRRSRASRQSAAQDYQSFDATLPAPKLEAGSLHPITRVTRELEDLFTSMGWSVLDGPEVETEFHNFDALNISGDHPARDTMDTFWVKTAPGAQRLVMRTHTSPVQVRAMKRLKPPFRAIVPGKVFRNEAVDASHEHTFHQMEGLVIDKDISVGHLIGAMKTLLRGIFGREIEIRLRPGYFPFVEPGFELDARCPFCKEGCSVCKRSTWIELLPCGMVHPNVLKSGGIDPEQWTGFAFGLGLSRLVMLRFGIDDVRQLLGGDVRFLEQF